MKTYSPFFSARHYRDTTLAIFAGQMLNRDIEGFAKAQITSRQRDLGTQGRAEIGLRNTNFSISAGKEGPLSSNRPASVPGNIAKVFMEASVSTKSDRFSLRSGVYCPKNGNDGCTIRGSGRLTIPLKGKGLGL